MTAATRRTRIPPGLLKNRWLSSLVSLVVGLALGTTVGRDILKSTGVPASCVHAIQRADRALKAGQAVADDGRAALDAVKGVHFTEVGDLLGRAKREAATLFDEAGRFNTARHRCDRDRT